MLKSCYSSQSIRVKLYIIYNISIHLNLIVMAKHCQETDRFLIEFIKKKQYLAFEFL